MTSEVFELHSRLIDATTPVLETGLSKVLMMEDRRIPWLLLVPKRPNVEEFHHLSADDRVTLIQEIATISEGLEHEFSPVRINVGDLGNIVGQMHIHLVARKETDPFWPKVVWSQEREPFRNDDERQAMSDRLRRACSKLNT